MLIDWKPEYSVKVKEIDAQHKNIFKLLDNLHNAINEGTTQKKLRKIVDGLAAYSVYHFDTEEKYFDKFNYENSKEHKKEHKRFKKKVTGVLGKLDRNEMEISAELIDFLEDWIIEHVTGSDQLYVKCFTEHGLK